MEGIYEGDVVDGDNVGIADGVDVDGCIVLGSAEGNALGVKLGIRWCK